MGEHLKNVSMHIVKHFCIVTCEKQTKIIVLSQLINNDVILMCCTGQFPYLCVCVCRNDQKLNLSYIVTGDETILHCDLVPKGWIDGMAPFHELRLRQPQYNCRNHILGVFIAHIDG